MRDRRSLLKGLAALPLASVPALAVGQPTTTDPVFAAIEKHKAAVAAYDAAVEPCGKQVIDPPHLEAARVAASEAEEEARYAMHGCVPTTLAGLAAYVAHWVEYVSTDDWLEEEGWEAIPTIAEAMAALFPAGGKGGAA